MGRALLSVSPSLGEIQYSLAQFTAQPSRLNRCEAHGIQNDVVLMTAHSIGLADQCLLSASKPADKPTGRSQPRRRPACGCIASLSWFRSLPFWVNRASRVFPNISLSGQLHHLLSQQLFQFGILNLKCFQSLGLRHFHAARFGPPLIKRRIAHALIAAQLLRAKPCL